MASNELVRYRVDLARAAGDGLGRRIRALVPPRRRRDLGPLPRALVRVGAERRRPRRVLLAVQQTPPHVVLHAPIPVHKSTSGLASRSCKRLDNLIYALTGTPGPASPPQ